MGGSYSQNIGMLEQWVSESRPGPTASGKRRRNTHAGSASLLHHLDYRSAAASCCLAHMQRPEAGQCWGRLRMLCNIAVSIGCPLELHDE